MKRKKMLVMATVFAMLFGLAQIAGASNHFMTTDGDSDVINFYGLADGCSFGVYDFGATDPSSGLDLLQGSSSLLFESAEFEVYLNQGDNNYYVNVKTGVDELVSPINIGDSDEFSFYFWNGSTYDIEFTITSGGGDTYKFDSNFGGTVLGDDLNPVPLPGSVILLFSGIMGLVAFGSRRKIMK